MLRVADTLSRVAIGERWVPPQGVIKEEMFPCSDAIINKFTIGCIESAELLSSISLKPYLQGF